MRFTMRAVALVVALVTAMAGLSASLIMSTSAQAQTPVPAVVQPAPAAVVPTTSEAGLARLAGERMARQRALTLRLAKAQAAARANARLRSRVVTLAKRQVGDRYSAGATGPSAFDCSGLTRYVFKVAAGKSLPHQSRAQYSHVKKIRFRDARPGDLVFFFRNGAHHVGVYIGGGHMVDAAGYGKGVRVSPITGSWWSRSYTGMGRILPA